MKAIRRLCLWYGILTKRVLKQKVYLAILLLIPLTVFAIRLMPDGSGGLLSVALARLGDDAFSVETIDRLTSGKSVIKYTAYETEDAAIDAVRSGKCDVAWIFRKDAGAQMDRFAAGRSTDGAVTVVEREQNAILNLSSECLYVAMIPYVAYGTYSDYLEDMAGETLPEDELREYFNAVVRRSSLIDYYYLDGTRVESGDLLTAPVRGLLAMIILLAALASCINVCREEQMGIFERLSGRRRAFLPLFCHVTAIVPTAIACLAALYFSGLWVGWQRELLTMLLYVIGVAAFCEILRVLCRSEVTLGAIIPVLMTLMMVLCPVFVALDRAHILQYCMPPFFYLNAALNTGFLARFALYDCAVFGAAAAAVLIRRRING